MIAHPRSLVRLVLLLLIALLALAPQVRQAHTVEAASLSFTVTSPADTHDASPGNGLCADAASHCTLRAAIEEANAQSVGSAITITIPAGTYLLSLGTLAITRNTVTLAGAGPGVTTLDGQGHRVLAVAVTAFAKIGGLTLTGGNAGSGAGGALANLGLAILRHSAVSSNTAKNGGGIYNAPSAQLLLLNSSVVSDTALRGGGIVNQGTLTVAASSLISNTAIVGGAIASTGTLTLSASIVATNSSTINIPGDIGGGGIYTSGTATLTSSTVSGNSSLNGGGIGNQGTLTLTSSTVSNNSGGGISSSGTATLTNSTVSGNRASYGGGIASGGTLTLTSSTVSSNSADFQGGGIENGGTLTLTNSTVSGNSAGRGGYGNGGGIYSSGIAALTSSTVSSNSAGSYALGAGGGGLYNYTGGTLTLTQTIVAQNTEYSSSLLDDCVGILTSGGYNLVGIGGCGLTNGVNGDQVGTSSPINPLLGPLANNGGPTQTMALQSGSPAIDRGDTAATGCPTTDQRGQPRPDAGETQCDIGAFESQGVG